MRSFSCAIQRRSSLTSRRAEKEVSAISSRVSSGRALPQYGLQMACGNTEESSAPCDPVCAKSEQEVAGARDSCLGIVEASPQNTATDSPRKLTGLNKVSEESVSLQAEHAMSPGDKQQEAEASKNPYLVVVSPKSLRVKVGKRSMKRIATKRARHQAERKHLEPHNAPGELCNVSLEVEQSAQQLLEGKVGKLAPSSSSSSHVDARCIKEEMSRRLEEEKLNLEREFKQRLDHEFQRLQTDHQQKLEECRVRTSISKKSKSNVQLCRSSNLHKASPELEQERLQLTQRTKECQKQMDQLRRQRRQSAATARALDQQKKELEQERVRLLREVEGMRKQQESKRSVGGTQLRQERLRQEAKMQQEAQQQLEQERARMDQERQSCQSVKMQLTEERQFLEQQKLACQIERKRLQEERLGQEAKAQAEIQQQLERERNLVQQERLDCQNANARLQEERQHVEQQKLDCQIEKRRLQEEFQQNTTKSDILERRKE